MSVSYAKCERCGHEHRGGLVPITTKSWGTRWYCHEDDHSCYNAQKMLGDKPAPLLSDPEHDRKA